MNFDSDRRLFDIGANSARLYKTSGSVSVRICRDRLRSAVNEIQSAYREAELRYSGKSGLPSSAEWLLDNRYLAVREAKLAEAELMSEKKLRASSDGAVLILLTDALVKAAGGRVDETSCTEFLKGVQSVTVLPLRELELFPAALRCSLIIQLARSVSSLSGGGEELEALFTSLRTLSSADMQALLEEVDVSRRLLMLDPAGVYPRMNDSSRAYYRRVLSEKAEKAGIDEHILAEKLIEECKSTENGARHIGSRLLDSKPKKGGLYIAANLLLTLFFTLLCAFISHSIPAALLLLLPISELTKSLLDNILLQCVSPVRLPGFDLSSGIPDEGRTVCVISALLTDRSSAVKLADSLERLYLSNRSGGKNLSFGILADLPEARSAVTSADAPILNSAARAVDGLNKKYGGGFYLFTRPRVSDRGSEKKFSGFERKRGAVLSLAKLLLGKSSELRVVSGNADALEGTKFIITLDSDTRPYPGSLTELVSAMLHPLNRPVLDREKGLVTSGHGILHPRMSTVLSSASASDFSRLFAGIGGSEPYSVLCGELYMDLFRRGGFSGKGIIDAECLVVCSEKHIPDGSILSHDAPEGAYLRGGFLSDVEFSDSFPASPVAYYRRSHRWIRGDWQNIGFILRRSSLLPDIERFKLFDSLRRSLVPVMTFVSIFLGLMHPDGGLRLAAAAALLSLCSRLLIAFTEQLAVKPAGTRLRYYSRMLHGIGAALLQTLVRLWLLPYEAWICFSAAVTSLWRMLFSRKNLLQWETSAQSELKRRSLAAFTANMWFALLSGAALALLSRSVAGTAAGLFWFTAPLCALALSLPARKAKLPDAEQKKYLLRCCEDIWSYFETFCAPEDNYLPPDNFQEQPPVGIAHRTSPTNIGFGLVSALCALDLGIDHGSAMPLISKMLDTLCRMPRWRGHFYNWYDTRTLRPLTPAYISTVDSGNLCASLIALKNGLVEHHRPDLAEKAAELLAPMDFSLLYDSKRCLFRIGIDLEKHEPSPAHYDLFAGEARLTSFLAVARGDVPCRHWRGLSRALRRCDGYSGMASWTGTMFEYLMPELFLPLIPDSLMYETARCCLYVQKKRRSPSGTWGISESAFYALDPALSYRYKAHGCGALALKRGQDKELVIAPYASFLALAAEPEQAYANLRRLEAAGAYGRFGFTEAVDYTPSRTGGKGERVRCFMAHHLGMSMLAAANRLRDGIVIRRFMSEPEMGAYRALLEEKLPVNAPVLRLSESAEPAPKRAAAAWLLRGETTDFEAPRCSLLSNGVYNIMSTESGVSRAMLRDVLIYRSPKHTVGDGHGPELYFETDRERFSLLPEPNVSYSGSMWELSDTRSRYSLVNGPLRSDAELSVSGSENGELRCVALTPERELSGRLVFSFEPVLAPLKDYVNHPAYWRLGLEADNKGDALILHRLSRGSMSECFLCLACDGKIRVSADRYGGIGALSAPLVKAEAELSLKAGETLSLRFAICAADDPDDAYTGVQRILSSGTGDCGAIPSLCAARLGMDGSELGRTMDAVRPLVFPSRWMSPAVEKARLWRFGISGDLPIICVPNGSDGSETEKLILRFCLLRLCGLEADLVLFTDEGGEYTRPLHSLVRDTLARNGLEPLLDDRGGVHLLPTEAEPNVLSCAAFVFGEREAPRRDNARYYLPLNAERDGGIPRCEYLKDGSFVFYVNQTLPPKAWTHILTNGSFSYLAADCGLGNMWYMNAREARIDPWRNDPHAVSGPEVLEYYVNNKSYSLFASGDGIPCRVRYSFGCAVWEKRIGDAGIRCTAFVPEQINARVFIIEALGQAAGQLHMRTELTLSDSEDDLIAVKTEFINGVLHASSARFPYDRELLMGSSQPPAGYTCDLYSALRREYDGKLTAMSVPCFAAYYPAAPVYVLVCGVCSEAELNMLCKPENAFAELERVKALWHGRVCGLALRSGNTALDRYMSGWAVYQTLACRLMARSSLYQSGGAVGFRDQLQDAVNLIHISPEYAKKQILECCAHQYTEGDVMHWWHSLPDGDRGVRTRCSDDMLWLVWALCEYTEKTGDTGLCSTSVNYVNSSILGADERDRYECPSRSELSESVADHARRAADCCIRRGVGEHGLLLFGSGDWNDGMDRVGGESVWLSFFFAHTVKRFSELLIELCKPGSDYYRGKASELGKAADSAWDGAWYLRGYWPDGTPLGSSKGEECRIDSVSQSWAALCPDSSNSRIDTALDSALRLLYSRDDGLVRLFDPPFGASGERDPGYIRSYGGGFRENGGQYTHAAVWLAMACLRRGRTEDGYRILCDLLPENHELSRYMGEPFVLPADVYACEERRGEAGWTWYTGSSGWYFRVVTEELLGLKLWQGRLYIRPNLPDGFPTCSVIFGRLRIVLEQCEISVNGEKYDGKGIPYEEIM